MIGLLDKSDIEKVFKPRDVFYNNGIVNFYVYLLQKGWDIPRLSDNNALRLSFKKNREDEVYSTFLNDFIGMNNIVHQTENYRWYWNDQLKKFELDHKFDVKGSASGNDVKHGVYKYIDSDKLDIPKEKLCELFESLLEENNVKDKAYFDDLKKLKSGKKVELVLHITKDEAVANFAENFAGGAVLEMDSKIHQFEDGQSYFRDMFPNKKERIDRWDALIYWYGSRTKYFFSGMYYMYPNSYELEALYRIKREMRIRDDEVERLDKETGKKKSLHTNVEMDELLSRDGIINKNFYISKSEQEFELKFFMYLFSFIYHIEDDYLYNAEDTRTRVRKEELYNYLKKLTFVTFTKDGSMKSSLNEYSRVYELLSFFEQLKSCKIDEGYSNMFAYLSNLITAISLSKSQKVENQNIKLFADNMLNFRSLRKNYFLAAYDSLKNNSRTLGRELYRFERFYLNKINGGETDMELHEKGKVIGDGIGKFASNLQNNGKDLLFGLRSIKNHKQFISYFKDLKFMVLKNLDSGFGFTKDFSNALLQLMEELDRDHDRWELVRDYIAIYAIEKYRTVNYAKSQEGGK